MRKKESIVYQDLRDVAKTVLRGKFLAVNSCKLKKTSQINNLYLKLGKEQTILKESRRKKIIKLEWK